jgi:hypothetical protein
MNRKGIGLMHAKATKKLQNELRWRGPTMYIYAVIATSQASVEPIRLSVQSAFPDNHIAAGDMCWLVADALDVRVVSSKLGVADNTQPHTSGLTHVIVMWAISYWGSADVNIWAWISQKMQQPPQPVAQQPAR